MDYLKENKWFVLAGASTALFSTYLLKEAFSKLRPSASSNSSLKNTDQDKDLKSPKKIGEGTYKNKKKIPFYRICLTGGPCAGKTSGILFTYVFLSKMKINLKKSML
jgi:hypothetical protein